MFNNSLDGILKSFTKVNARLEAFATKEEANAEAFAEQEATALKNKLAAYDNAFTARKISGKITSLIS